MGNERRFGPTPQFSERWAKKRKTERNFKAIEKYWKTSQQKSDETSKFVETLFKFRREFEPNRREFKQFLYGRSQSRHFGLERRRKIVDHSTIRKKRIQRNSQRNKRKTSKHFFLFFFSNQILSFFSKILLIFIWN